MSEFYEALVTFGELNHASQFINAPAAELATCSGKGEDDPENKPHPRGVVKAGHFRPVLEQYFDYVSKTGRPVHRWTQIRTAFLWKLQTTIDDFIKAEALAMDSDEMRTAFLNGDDLKEIRRRVIERSADFEGIPFTYQRICELLVQPQKHYKKAIKFLRALEKTVNVVTTITNTGERVTGAPLSDVSKETAAKNIETEILRGAAVSVDLLAYVKQTTEAVAASEKLMNQ